jgi:CubicO group peptidase (beta-lactamase class C family)
MSRYRFSLCGFAAVACFSACATYAPAVTTTVRSNPADSLAIDSIVSAAFALDLAPGLAVAVVRGDEVVYLRGFGFADREANRPVTPETIFYIASTTKAFTGLAAAVLAGRGRVNLDAPLSHYVPTARLHEPLSADSITLRALLSHTHGISNDGPIVWRTAFSGEFAGNDELIRLLAEHAPARTGRAFQYGNIGYNVAGIALDRALGRSWRDVLAEEIFRPLEMTSTSAYVSRVPQERLAMPYLTNGDGFDRTFYLKTDANMQAAGGLVSSGRDLARWLEAQLNNGRLDGQQAIPASALAETQRIQAAASGDNRGLRQVGYSLGWNVLLRGTDTLYAHGGGFTGFATHVSFLPAHRLGVAAMANEGRLGGFLAEVVARRVYERFAGPAAGAEVPPDLEAQIQRMREGITADRARRATRPQTLPFPLEAYVGTYANPSYGTLEVRIAGGRLEAHAGAARSRVEVFDATRNLLRVELSGSGSVVQVEMEDGRARSLKVGEQVFVRRD